MKSTRPKAKSITTTEFCKYGCGCIAKFQFANGTLCCSKHQNSCSSKREKFSNRTDHHARAVKSLNTRIRLGITKNSQIKGGETRRRNGHYQKLATVMREHWKESPWDNNVQCPILPYKDTEIPYQGTYELAFLQGLEKQFGLNWVKNNVSRGPSVWYIDPVDGVKKLYISDFIIQNTIYEIKSKWTWNKTGMDPNLELRNKAKLLECVKLGYTVKLILEKKEITI